METLLFLTSMQILLFFCDIFEIKIPAFVENLWGFVVSLMWIGFVRYTFFNHKSNEELIASFKKPSGMFIGILITAYVSLFYGIGSKAGIINLLLACIFQISLGL